MAKRDILRYFDDINSAYNDSSKYDTLSNLLDELEPRWISVSEEQPKEKYYCLCCDEEGYITIGYFSVLSKEWCFVDMEIDIDVIAWMPLPEPYKEG